MNNNVNAIIMPVVITSPAIVSVRLDIQDQNASKIALVIPTG